jgi:hypothetical protein
MDETTPRAEQSLDRRVFKHWSIAIPAGMGETFVEDEGYCHAWDERRSISLTSVVVSDGHGRPIQADRILEKGRPIKGEVVPTPNELAGWTTSIETPESEQAGSALSGILVVDGRVLVITVTCDDPEWARTTWRSIRHHETGDLSGGPAARRHRR